MIFLSFWHLITSTSNWFYGIVSGWLGDIGLLTGIIIYYKKHNCHVKGCPRIGKLPVAGTPYITCKSHHPTAVNQDITHEHILAAHKGAINDKTRSA